MNAIQAARHKYEAKKRVKAIELENKRVIYRALPSERQYRWLERWRHILSDADMAYIIAPIDKGE